MTKEIKTGLALLREPFQESKISLLPKPYKRDSPKGNCKECGGYHGLPAAHLRYVGHAALTDRLLDADPSWTWEPVAVDAHGMPLLDGNGGMWIRLTVCGVSRLGYGDAQNKTGPDAVKERIGDALRNAAMRFGAALDLWHKGEWDEEDKLEQKAEPEYTAIDAEAVASHMTAMREAENMDKLAAAFTAAQKYARLHKDATALCSFTEEKDRLKTFFEQEAA